MVTHLLTLKIKVDIPLSNRLATKGDGKVKKIDPRRGIWDWLFGGGWAGGGSGG